LTTAPSDDDKLNCLHEIESARLQSDDETEQTENYLIDEQKAGTEGAAGEKNDLVNK
jgi:hypothetical protein